MIRYCVPFRLLLYRGDVFVVDGASKYKDRGLFGVNVNAEENRALTVFGRYDDEFAELHQFQAGAAVRFWGRRGKC